MTETDAPTAGFAGDPGKGVKLEDFPNEMRAALEDLNMDKEFAAITEFTEKMTKVAAGPTIAAYDRLTQAVLLAAWTQFRHLELGGHISEPDQVYFFGCHDGLLARLKEAARERSS
jgi:hypothetical protein